MFFLLGWFFFTNGDTYLRISRLFDADRCRLIMIDRFIYSRTHPPLCCDHACAPEIPGRLAGLTHKCHIAGTCNISMYMIHIWFISFSGIQKKSTENFNQWPPGTWSSTISSPWCVLRQESKWRRSHEGSDAERRRKKGKAGKLSNGTEAKQPRDIHLMWQPCIYSHLSELCKWLLLGIKKFPCEKLALDDFGNALKSILADATEHWA